MNTNESQRSWRHHSRTPSVQLYVSEQDGRAGALVGEMAAGFSLVVHPCDTDAELDPAGLADVAAAIIEVSPDNPASIRRFETIAKLTRTPLLAAVHEPRLALVRQLIRAGALDVLPLPIDRAEIEAALLPLREKLDSASASVAATGKLVTVIKSRGGAGATALLGQMAVRIAERQAGSGRETCIVDLDIQFGDAAFQLGLRPALTLYDLLESGGRLDGDLLRATTAEHPSGLKVIAAPGDMLPLDAISSEQVLDVIDLATRQFSTVFVDLPSNWTNWSLSLLARSDVVLLITPVSIPALRQARRQLDLLRSQDLGNLDVKVVANRCSSGLFKKIRPADIRSALGCNVAFDIADDEDVMDAAINQGVPIAQIKRKSAVGKDLDKLAVSLLTALGQNQ